MISHGKNVLVSFALIFGLAATSGALETVPCTPSLDAVLGSENTAEVALDSPIDNSKEEQRLTVSVPGPGLVRWTSERSPGGKLEVGSRYCGQQDAGARLLGHQGREVRLMVLREGSFSLRLPATARGVAELRFEPLDVRQERFTLESPFGGMSYTVLQTTLSDPADSTLKLEAEEVDPDPTSKSMGSSRTVLLVAERVTTVGLEAEEVDPDPTLKLEAEEVDPDPTLKLEAEEVDPDPTARVTAMAPRHFEWLVTEAGGVTTMARLRWSVTGASKLEAEEVDPDPTLKLEAEEVDPDPTLKLEAEEVDPDPTALAETWQSMGWTFPREFGEQLLEDPVPFAWWALGLTEMVEQ